MKSLWTVTVVCNLLTNEQMLCTRDIYRVCKIQKKYFTNSSCLFRFVGFWSYEDTIENQLCRKLARDLSSIPNRVCCRERELFIGTYLSYTPTSLDQCSAEDSEH